MTVAPCDENYEDQIVEIGVVLANQTILPLMLGKLPTVLGIRICIRIRIRMSLDLPDPHHKYGSDTGSGSFHHQAKIVEPWFLLFCNFFMTFLSLKNDVSGPVFGPPRSTSGSVCQRYGSEDPDLHTDPYQNVTDLTYHLLIHLYCTRSSKFNCSNLLNSSWSSDADPHDAFSFC